MLVIEYKWSLMIIAIWPFQLSVEWGIGKGSKLGSLRSEDCVERLGVKIWRNDSSKNIETGLVGLLLMWEVKIGRIRDG